MNNFNLFEYVTLEYIIYDKSHEVYEISFKRRPSKDNVISILSNNRKNTLNCHSLLCYSDVPYCRYSNSLGYDSCTRHINRTIVHRPKMDLFVASYIRVNWKKQLTFTTFTLSMLDEICMGDELSTMSEIVKLLKNEA